MAIGLSPEHSLPAQNRLRHPAPHQIMEMLEELTQRAQQTAGRVDSVLSPVAYPSAVAGQSPEKASLSTPLPPLFSAQRTCFVEIYRALESINETLDRVSL